MKGTLIKMLVVTLIVGAIALPLGMMLWPAGIGGEGIGPAPSGMEIGLLILIAIFEALAFGLGIAFVLFGLPLVRSATGGAAGWTWAMFLSIAWLLLSWWPHSGLHRSMGEHASLWNLIAIEYGFHFTNIAAAAIVAIALIRLLGRAAQPSAASARPELDIQPQAGVAR